MSGYKEKKNIALTSVIAAVFLTSFKLTVGIWTNSLGILSEAAHSGLDLIAALITLFAVSFADRPADVEHQYGHGKLENISALFETILLFITCAWIIIEAVDRIVTHQHHVEISVWSFVVMTVSVIIDVSRSRALYRIAKKYNSQALEADALHFSSDVWTSLTVIAGLVFVSYGYPIFDSIAAIVVALLVLFVSYRLGRRTIDALMDKAPPALDKKIIEAIKHVDNVEEVRKIRIRSSGTKIFVDVVVYIPRTIAFQDAHNITENIEKSIRKVCENADVVVHAEPSASKGETLADKIRMLVMGKGLGSPHNVEIQNINGKHHVNFDVEYARGQSFAEAHRIASEIEQQIYEEIPSVSKVTIHMEEYQHGERETEDVTKTENNLLASIQKVVNSHESVRGCKDISLLREKEQYDVSITCQIDKAKTLDEVHKVVSEIESAIYQNFKKIRRVTIHAEPE